MKILRLLVVAGALLTGLPAWAQMPHDAIYMPKNSACIAGMYGQSTWNEYWEGSLKRENFNIGTHTTQSAMLMPAIGLSNRVNLILSLPYVWTKTSAGNLMGQRGFGDLSGWLKVRIAEHKGLSLHGVVGGSLPASRYVPDFLPMSIGLGARTVTSRLLVNYTHPRTGLYLTAHGSYNWRSNIRVDRDSYYANERLHQTNEVQVPNGYDAAVRVGVLRQKWQTEVFAERMANLSGDDIRRNDMPFPTNNMQATTVGWYGKLQPRHIGVNARIGYAVAGRNMGQATSYTLGLLYQIGGL
ncbi:hypothetical protein [Rudanella lutea]|uniref:hypothetical protein n=1 Tax=Rudanella lutea TaxID=451374 RepID=UPI000364AD3C|nr:hypothetical protein [Rudanella lutea]